jgi:protein FrlC
MKFAQCSAVYFNYSLQYAINDLASMGYQGIEIWGGRPHMYRDDLDEQLDGINGLLTKHDMTVCNFTPCQFRYPSILASEIEKIRKNSIEYIKTGIDNAVKVNAPSIHLCAGMALLDKDPRKGWSLLKKSIEEINEYAIEKGKHVLIEPAHRFESNLILTIDDGLRMIDEVKSNNLGILLDTGHVNVNREEFQDIISHCKDIPFHVHIDDNNGDIDAHLIPGKGNIDFKKLKKELDVINYSGWLSVELGGSYWTDPTSACKESLDFLRKTFQ